MCHSQNWGFFNNLLLLSGCRGRLFVIPWTVAFQTSPFFAVSQSLLKLMSIVSVIQSNHLTLCHPIVLLPLIFLSIRVFSVSSSHELAKELERFSFSLSPSDEYSGLISFRIDWFGLLTIQGTLKSLLQHHKHQFFSTQPSI